MWSFAQALWIGLIGSISLCTLYFSEDRIGKYFISWIIRYVVTVFFLWLYINFSCTVLAGIDIAILIIFFLMLNNFADAIACYFLCDDVSVGGITTGIVAFVVWIILLLSGIVGFWDGGWMKETWTKIDETDKIEASVFYEDPVDETHVRVVSKQTAYWRARQSMTTDDGTNLGTYFKFLRDDFSIQRVNNELYWVAPLQFVGWIEQGEDKSGGYTPGFIMVSAEDYNEEVKLITTKPDGTPYMLRYLTKSWFDLKLNRKLRDAYPNLYLTDYTLEIDEELRPWMVVSFCERVKLFSYHEARGVIIVDPETFEHKKYDIEDVPEWVDRVVPEYAAIDKFRAWGDWKEGISWGQRAWKKEPTEVGGKTEAWMVYGSDGQPYWFSGFTSQNASDSALTGMAYLNTRTGKFIYIPRRGPNEEQVVQAVEQNLPKMNVDFTVCDPIPYNLYGNEDSWVCSVISNPGGDADDNSVVSGQLLRVAIVDGSNSKVIIGETKEEALLNYRNYLAQKNGVEFVASANSDLRERTGIIQDITSIIMNGSTQFRVRIIGYPYTFSIPITVSDKMGTRIEFAKPGDKIELQYNYTQESILMVNQYKLPDQPDIKSDTYEDFLENQERSEELEDSLMSN